MFNKEQRSLYFVLSIVIVILSAGLLSFHHLEQKPYADNPLETALKFYEQKDYKQAAFYFAQADTLNIAQASFALGAMYFSGKGIEQDIDKAFSYYEKAAGMNYAPAQTTLALLYIYGKNIAQDMDKGLHYLQNAAGNGEREAQLLLAKWYENGENVDKDMEKAVHFYKKAARQGDINAKLALAVIYKNGAPGIPANPYTAAHWQESIKKQKNFENIFQNQPSDHVSIH